MHSNTLILLIPTELGALEELEMRSQRRETISHNRLLEALTFKETRIYRHNPLDRNMNSTTNLVTEQWYTCEGDSTIADSFVRLLWPCSCSYESQKHLIRVLV